MPEQNAESFISQIGFMDHVPRFTFDGGRYVLEDHFLSAVRGVKLSAETAKTLAGLSRPAPAAVPQSALTIATEALKRITLDITGDAVPPVLAGDALDRMAVAESAAGTADPRDSARLEAFIAWYLRGGKRQELHEFGHTTPTTREILLASLDTMAGAAQATPSAAPVPTVAP